MKTPSLSSCLFLCFFLILKNLSGQSILKDINTGTNSAHFGNGKVFKNQFIISADAGNLLGYELYEIDPDAHRIQLFKDIFPGPVGSYPSNFVCTDSLLYFKVRLNRDGADPFMLMQTDGTEKGSKIVFNPKDSTTFSPIFMERVGNDIYFLVNKKGQYQLWKTDQKFDRPTTVFIYPPEASLSLGNFIGSWNDRLIFSVYDKLWATNGTETVNITPSGTSGFSSLFEIGQNEDVFYFIYARQGNAHLWKTNGTQEGTELVKRLNRVTPLRVPGASLLSEGKFLFLTNSFEAGNQMWQTDGTTEGTKLFSELDSLSFIDRSGIALVNGKVLLFANQPSQGFGLWEIREGQSPSLVKSISPQELFGISSFVIEQHQLFFTVHGEGKSRLYKSDGTPEGTIEMGLEEEVFWNPYIIGAFSGRLFFVNGDVKHGWELWSYHLEDDVMELFYDLNTSQRSSQVSGFYPIGQDAVFPAYSIDDGHTLWKYDTQVDTVGLLKKLERDSTTPPPLVIGTHRDRLFFVSNESWGQDYIWVSDGTNTGTKKWLRLEEGYTMDTVAHKTCDDQFYFVLNSKTSSFGENKVQIWSLSGSDVMPELIFADSLQELPISNLECADKNLLFKNQNSWFEVVLPENQIKPVKPVPNTEYFDIKYSYKNGFFAAFYAKDQGEIPLWYGTQNGGLNLIRPPLDSAKIVSIDYFFQDTAYCYFITYNWLPNRTELWRTDATVGGTQRVTTLGKSKEKISEMGGFVALLGKTYFWTKDGGRFYIWVTDGSEKGTYAFHDFKGGDGPIEMIVHNGLIYFSGTDGLSNRRQLWQTDGAPEQTRPVEEFCDDECAGDPKTLTSIGDHLFFTAYTLENGREPWRYQTMRPTSIAEKYNAIQPEMDIFPNPVVDGGEIWLRFSGQPVPQQLEMHVWNLQGQWLSAQNLTSEGNGTFSASLGGLPAGSYLLAIKGPQFQKVQKVVILRSR